MHAVTVRWPRAIHGGMGVRTVVVALLSTASGFYLPGIAPHEYADGERVEIKVNQLSSTKTQMPYDYYSLPFCKPAETVSAVENLGEVLHGSVIQNSPYDIFMGKTDFKVLCRVELNPKESALLAKRIKEDYRVHLIMDNLPAATKVEDLKLCLNASDCAAVMFDTVIIEVRKGGSVLKRKLDTKGVKAVILPCLERIVHSLTHSIGIELLSIFFFGVFAIALRRRCMTGAGSNMLRAHAYVKLRCKAACGDYMDMDMDMDHCHLAVSVIVVWILHPLVQHWF